MARYQATLAYDGTHYLGFQRQAGDGLAGSPLTVQGAVEAALRNIGWQGESILSAGRTDTGVHASGQVIAFDMHWRHSSQDLLSAVNANLPMDIAVQALQAASAEFHPRYDASRRCYAYRVLTRPVRHPLLERYSWRVWPAPNPDLMQQGAGMLVGKRDFSAFGTPPAPEGSAIREIFSAHWRVEEIASGMEMFVFEVAANAFLYHMVRRMVHVLVEIGQGRLSLQALRDCLASPPDEPLQGLAPACGLVLERVEYAGVSA